MSDPKNLTTINFDPIVCGNSCCNSLKWKCTPDFCYPILAKRVFSCTKLKSTPLQSNLVECTFITDLPSTTTLPSNKSICIENIESVTFNCLGLREYSNGVSIPNTITQSINFEPVNFLTLGTPCTGTGVNNINIYTKYRHENYIPNVAISDLCNQEGCDTADGINLNVNYSTDQYGVYGLTIKVKAKLKNDTLNIGSFTATAIISDPQSNGGAGDTNFLLSDLGFGPVHFYGNLCLPIKTPCDIYKTFSGSFSVSCINKTTDLSALGGASSYSFDAHSILCFCPVETIKAVVEEVIAVPAVVKPDLHCSISTPCKNACDGVITVSE